MAASVKSQGKHDYRYIAEHWREWFRNKQYDIEYQDGIIRTFIDQVLEFTKGDENKRLNDIGEEMVEERWEYFRKAIAIQESNCPIGFFRPSWEQAKILNAWHPEYEPDKAPNGYQSVGIFSANRIGKTCAVVINTLLWILPDDPEWEMFRELTDPDLYNVDGDTSSGIRRPSRGKYRIHRRPNWEFWRRTGKLEHPYKSDPPMSACEIWHGCENDNDWHSRIAGKWRSKGGKDGYLAWMPVDSVGKRPDGVDAILKQERTIEFKLGHTIIGKTYGAEDQSWGGKVARIVNMDEGFDMGKYSESRTRVEDGGYYMWAYTPTEARNNGKRSKVAWDCWKGNLELVGNAKFFTSFTMQDAPQQVIGLEKKATDIKAFTKLGKEGKARMMGGFFESSPRVFFHFDREKHILPWAGSEVIKAIHGEGPSDLVRIFHQANIIRGFDEGTAHPTTCSWVAILRSGEYVLFREFSEENLSITERCVKIIELSRNKREVAKWHSEESLRRYVEKVPTGGMVIRRTFADSKIFRRNPDQPSDDWTQKYRDQGLRMERAGNIGPAARCDATNDLFLGDATRSHLVTKETPGFRLYVTVDCEIMKDRFENYLFQQYASGPNAGQFTGQPDKFGDDEIDSICYCAISKLRWRDPNEDGSPAVIRRDAYTGAVLR